MYVSVDRSYSTPEGEVFAVSPIVFEEELEAAVEDGRPVRAMDGDDLGDVLFDGGEWVGERPDLPRHDATAEVTTVPYVDQRVDLLQAEVEALTDALLEVDPENATALAVKGLAPDARIAIAFDEEADMDEVIASLRTPVKEAK